MTTNNVTTEPDASALLAEMRARGIRFVVYRKRGSVDIVLRPYRLVTEADRAALRDRWDAVKALVLAEEEATNAAPAVATVAPMLSSTPQPQPTPTDDVWFEMRGWPPKRVPIARFDPAKVDEFLTLVRRNAMRRDDE